MCAVLDLPDVATGSIYDEVLVIPEYRRIVEHSLAAFMYASDLYSVVDSVQGFDHPGIDQDEHLTEIVHCLAQVRREIKFVEQLLLPF